MRCLGVLGDVVEDVVCWLEEEVQPGTDTATTVHRNQGGQAANVAISAARGVPTRFIGAVGDDPGGELVRRQLEAHGVDPRLQRGSRTGTIVILVRPDGERDMFPDRGASAEITDIDPAWLDGLAALHVTGYSLQAEPTRSAVVAAARQVHDRGGWVSIDLSSAGVIRTIGTDAFAALVAGVAPDVVFANADEAALLPPSAFPGAVVVVKRGPEPVALHRSGEVREVAVPRTDVRDTTGAGDAFAGGFLAAAVTAGVAPVQAPWAVLEDWAGAANASAREVLAIPGATPPPRTAAPQPSPTDRSHDRMEP